MFPSLSSIFNNEKFLLIAETFPEETLLIAKMSPAYCSVEGLLWGQRANLTSDFIKEVYKNFFSEILPEKILEEIVVKYFS